MRLILTFFLIASVVRGAEGPEVLYSPEAVYTGKPMTFRVQPHGHAGSIRTNGVEWIQWAAASEKIMESSLYPEEAMVVEVLKEEEPAWTFSVVRPGVKGVLTERDGFLELDGQPVILMPDAKLPPKLDRRWETLNLLRQKLFEKKPVLPEPLWVIPPDSSLPDTLPESLAVTKARQVNPEQESWFRVNGFLRAFPRKSSPFVVVELDLYDLRRGMPPHVWIMKWQFALQHLQRLTGYEDGLLVAPDVPADSEWHDLLEEELESLARANGLRFIDRSREEVWKERLLDGLSKTYRLPGKAEAE